MGNAMEPRQQSQLPTGDAQPPAGQGQFVLYGSIVEFGLVPLAWILGWLTGLWSWKDLAAACSHWPSLESLGWGVLATLPMLVMLLAVLRMPSQSFKRLRSFLTEGLRPHLQGSSLAGLLCLSLAAGLGEEWLFRGLLQEGLTRWWEGGSILLVIVVVAVIFGICHWITHLYFLLATITGIYLGWLYWFSGGLVVPVLAHALYDFIALIVITRIEPDPGPQAALAEDPLSAGDSADRIDDQA